MLDHEYFGHVLFKDRGRLKPRKLIPLHRVHNSKSVEHSMKCVALLSVMMSLSYVMENSLFTNIKNQERTEYVHAMYRPSSQITGFLVHRRSHRATKHASDSTTLTSWRRKLKHCVLMTGVHFVDFKHISSDHYSGTVDLEFLRPIVHA